MGVELGWVLQPTSRTPENTVALDESNRAYLRALKPPFTTFWVEDHVQWADLPTLECWTALSYAAAEFPALQCGTLTLGQSYRNPALTAKMAATLQWLSGGRLILGIGAGWKEDEYRAYGYPYPSAGTRIAQLREAVQLMRKLWSDSPASYTGEYYQIDNAYCEPRPSPPPPILIGGGGEKKTLRVVAELADWWNGNFTDVASFRAKVAVLHRHCADIGRDPAEITLTYYTHVAIDRDASRVERRDPRRPEVYRIAGTPDEIAREMNEFIGAGVKHFMLKFSDFPALDGLRLFMDEVVPRLDR